MLRENHSMIVRQKEIILVCKVSYPIQLDDYVEGLLIISTL
jgi:hypothetical protein